MKDITCFRSYLRISLTIPVILPAVLLLLAYLASWIEIDWNQRLPEWLAIGLAFLVGSLIIGGIPYLLYYLFTWHYIKNKNRQEIIRYLLLSPVAFFILQFSCLFIFDAIQNLDHMRIRYLEHSLKSSLFISLFVFPFAYGYLGLILGGDSLRNKIAGCKSQTAETS